MPSSFRRFLANARNHFWEVTSWRLNSSAECQRESVTTTRRSPLRRSPQRNTAASSRTEQPSSVRLPATRRQNRSPPELHQRPATVVAVLIPQTFPDPLRCMPLFAMHLSIAVARISSITGVNGACFDGRDFCSRYPGGSACRSILARVCQ